MAVASLAALLSAAGAVSTPASLPTATAAEPANPPEPLGVTLTSVTPSALRPGRPVRLEGRITNVDDQDWRQVQVYLVLSKSPLTTRDELAATNDSPAGSYFGDRVADLGTFDRLGRLAPGEERPFRLRVPWSSLPLSPAQPAPGVYTAGAQVLATNMDGTRDLAALGRARTYLPLVDKAAAAPVRLATVWRIGAQVLRRRDGTYARTARLTSSMQPGGALRRVVDLGAEASAFPLTVVPDPAVLDAAKDIGSGQYGPPGGLVQRLAAGSPAPVDPGSGGGTTGDEQPAPVAAVADWSDDAAGLVAMHRGWTTPYGEPSVDTLATVGSESLDASISDATTGAQRRLLDRRARVLTLPDNGVVSAGGLAQIAAAESTGSAALAPRMLPGWDATTDGSTQRLSTDGGPLDVVVADPTLAKGGPTPGDTQSALQVRQRLLAETALLASSAAPGGTRPSATFVSPDGWDPGKDWDSAAFFAGLDVPWLKPVTLREQLATSRPYDGTPGLSDGTQLDELADVAPEETTAAALQLRRRVRVLADLVGGGRGLRVWYASAVALAISESTLRDPNIQQRLVQSVTDRVTRLLRGVTLTGPSFVTLSSSRGSFPLTVTNGLDRRISVSVRVLTNPAASTSGMTRFTSDERLTVGPGERDTVAIEARVAQAGVTSAEAYVVTTRGQRFGGPLAVSLRTSVVGVVIWAILGVACAVLAFAIARRLWRRTRRAAPS